MKLSIWRWSHMSLAVVSLFFILSATLTGIILSFDPLLHLKTTKDNKNIALHLVLDSLKNNHIEVFQLEQSNYGEWLATVLNEKGQNEVILIQPITGKEIAKPQEQSAFFKQTTAFHRSLFMGTAGRWIIAITSILLACITISGLFIVAQKVGGWFSFFTKLKKEKNVQFYHTFLGRYAFIFILIVAGTGILLFWKDALFAPEKAPELELYIENANPSEEQTPFSKMKQFQIPLSSVVKVEFPFSPDVEDPFVLETNTAFQVIHQYSGEVVEEHPKPSSFAFKSLIHGLHTGQNMGYWSLLLLTTCFSILYFCYSGLKITFQRLKANFKNSISPSEAEIILFVGSENGSTWEFAKALHQQLIKNNQKVYTVGMESKLEFPDAKIFILLTSTYGLGNAPANAKNFLKTNRSLFQKDVRYAIIGFGDKKYDGYCQFAFDLNQELGQSKAQEIMELCTIDNKNEQHFTTWSNALGEKLNLNIDCSSPILTPKKTSTYEVIHNTFSENDSVYFIVKLRVPRSVKSGDLISIFPPSSKVARQYSIAKTDAYTLLLYIRKHDQGLCSSYLSELKSGEKINAIIEPNTAFRLQKKSNAICIGNGTGLAPFIGFVNENKQNIRVYWGTKTKEVLPIISPFFPKETQMITCFSQEHSENKMYVTDRFLADIETIYSELENGTHLYICGALQIEKTIKEALSLHAFATQKTFANISKNIHSDCY